MRGLDARWQPGDFERNAAAVDELTTIAETAGVTIAQIALAWLLAQGDDIAPLFGTRSPARVEQNVAAAGNRYTSGHLPSWTRNTDTSGRAGPIQTYVQISWDAPAAPAVLVRPGEVAAPGRRARAWA